MSGAGASAAPGRRAFVVTLDACGIGALPDAADYGDAGADTLGHLAAMVGGLRLPTLEALGLGSVHPIDGLAPARAPAIHGRLHALGSGKDSTAGHWELMGVALAEPPPTYPEGFPPEVVAALEEATGQRFVCNRPYNGIDAIRDHGERHLHSGELILYTSQDSVLQIAAHVDRLPEAQLHEVCRRARAVMRGRHAVARVIARPFTGSPDAFARTAGRRDFALAPPSPTYLDRIAEAGVPVHAVGKVADLFAGVGIDRRHPGADNATALRSTDALLDGGGEGLVFVNLVETDQVYGHRKDVEGFHRALRDIDAAVARWLGRLGPGDLLVLTADHGCDPAAPHTDHTREHVPLLAVADGLDGRRHDGPMADVGATALRWLTGRHAADLPGSPFA